MTDAEVKQITEGLSEAQRELLVWAGSIDRLIPRRESQNARVLKRKGLGNYVDIPHQEQGLMVYWNKPLGLAVRDYLEKSDGK